VLKRICGVAAALFLLSCTLPKSQSTAPSRAPVEAMTAALPAAAGTYRIDGSRSELRLLVYRAGALANLGHNHVILNRNLNGSIHVASTLAASSLSFSVPVAGFIIDDAQARREEGNDFAAEIPDDAKAGTLKNMTGPALLDAAQYQTISLRSLEFQQSGEQFSARLAVSVAGHESTLDVPFVLTADRNSLTATAAFELRQTALGLTPFSLLLGALAVRDAMQVKLNVVAVMEPQH